MRDYEKTYKLSRFVTCLEYPNDKDYVLISNTRNLAQLIIPRSHYLENRYSASTLNILKEQEMVIPESKDEFQEYKDLLENHLVDSSIFNVVVMPTLNCNLTCTYCFQKNTINKNDLSFSNIELMVDEILAWVTEKGIRKINTTFFGGEPTLRPEIIEFYIKQFHKKNISNIVYSCNIVTNGVDLSKSFIGLLKKLNLESINVTIDGIEKVHNSRRFGENIENTFSTIITNINKYSERVKFSINIVIDEGNYFSLKQLAFFLSSSLKFKSKTTISLYLNHFAHKKINTFIKRQDILIDTYRILIESGFIINSPGRNAPCIFYRENTIVYNPNAKKFKCLNNAHDEKRAVKSPDEVVKPLFLKQCQSYEFLFMCNASCTYLSDIYKSSDFYCQKNEFSFFWNAYNLAKLKLYEAKGT